MTGNRFLLDTNIITAWLKGDPSVADKIDRAKEVHIPVIVLGELYYGALYSTHVQKNINDIKSIIGIIMLYPLTRIPQKSMVILKLN